MTEQNVFPMGFTLNPKIQNREVFFGILRRLLDENGVLYTVAEERDGQGVIDLIPGQSRFIVSLMCSLVGQAENEVLQAA